MSKEHSYTNGEVAILWKKDLCIHSKNCWKGLGEVFKPGERPWIVPEGASTDRIKAQIDQCPSGALSYRTDGLSAKSAAEVAPTKAEITSQGPILIKGNLEVVRPDGRVEVRDKVTAFCRCGGSTNKPYCDGSHKNNGFTDE